MNSQGKAGRRVHILKSSANSFDVQQVSKQQLAPSLGTCEHKSTIEQQTDTGNDILMNRVNV